MEAGERMAARRKTSPIRIALNGACGRMGRQITGLVLADNTFRVAAPIEVKGHPAVGRDFGEVLDRGPLGVRVATTLTPPVDVFIDFSAPEAAIHWAGVCAERRLPLVIGTTGLSGHARRKIVQAARTVPVVMAPNMSVGVNALVQAIPELVRLLGSSYDLEIVEMHHRHKRDAPSGTALALAEALAKAAGVNLSRDAVYGRQGDTGERPPRQIGVHAVRGGDVAGEHRIILAGRGEVVEVVHRAHSRELFAVGALRAARFAVAARAGLYSMADVLRQT
jgi:4-hydroxy-tetrahydrodipicolinate reductase